MPSNATTAVRAPALPRLRIDTAAVVAWALPFALILYLALKGGGYDPVVRGEIGVIVWWLVLLGALAGVLPAALSPVRLVGIGLFGAFCIWVGLGISSSESVERSSIELARVLTYGGVFALAALSVRRGHARQVVNGVACAIAIVGCLAVLSRLHPAWFPDNVTAALLPGSLSRLSYPLNYWNALAAFMAMGLPLLLGVTSWARTLVGQALAAAALPVLALCAFLTLSRGGAAACVVGLLAFMFLASDRLPKVATLLVTGAGSAILIAAANQREALSDGLTTSAAHHQGNEMLALVIFVAAGVALVQVAIGLAVRHTTKPAWMTPSRRVTGVAAAAVLATVLFAFLVGGGAGFLSDRWDEFKTHETSGQTAGRFGSTAGNGRYQYWQSAVDAYHSKPVRGIGAGTFEFWWARNGSIYSYVRDAHSLYVETLGELGLVGLVLLAGFLLWILGAGMWRAIRAPADRRVVLAAAAAGALAFCAAAAADWDWEIAVLPVTLMILGGVLVADRRRRPNRLLSIVARAALVLPALAALVFIVLPLASTAAVRRSQSEAGAQNLTAALADARTAERVEPSAATPRLQEALVLEEMGRFDEAAARATAAAAAEPTNWRMWVIRSRIDAEAGHARLAVSDYQRAKSLNPKAPLFQTKKK